MLLWGRGEPELLTAAVRSAGAGRPTVLVVEGDPGVGKTTLLDELVHRAGSFHVLSADGLEDEDVPFGVLAQWGSTSGSRRAVGWRRRSTQPEAFETGSTPRLPQALYSCVSTTCNGLTPSQ